ncbi:porin [Treponema sp. UBA6852]|uniref:porin n=1 Tax=Treponema sp. UBA6852 TaxID=1947744 RepID=UPI0025DBC7D3|nr:porin [Treponema sp. UBA6852]
MKKTLIAVAAAAALTATSAFAEITFGMWTKAVLVPVANDGEDYKAGLTQAWGGAARTAGLSVAGVNEEGTAGYTFEIRDQAGEDKIAHGDRSVLWVKPVEQFKLSVGYFDDGDNGLRQGSGFGAWDWLRPKQTTDLVFNGDNAIMDGKSGDGLMAEILPVDGLKVIANIPFLKTGEYIQDAYDIYKKTQIGAAYTIDGTGTLKVLWTGVSEESKIADKKYDYTGKIGVAFNLTAVENLSLAIGAKFDIVDEDYKIDDLMNAKEKGFGEWGGAKNKAYFALNAGYQVSDAMKVSLAGGVKLFKNSGFDPKWGIGAGVDYVIMEGLTLNTDLRYISETKYSKDGIKVDGKDDAVSFLVGVSKGFSNGSLGVGFEGVTNGAGFSEISAGTDKNGKVHDGFMWCVPVVLTFSF